MDRKPPASRNVQIDLNAQSIGTFGCNNDVKLVHDCCHRFLVRFPFGMKELDYSDPPYWLGARKSELRYRNYCEKADHAALLKGVVVRIIRS